MANLPYSLILCGFTSAGKSAVGKELATHLSVPFWDTDSMLAEHHGKTPQTLFAEYGEAHFRDMEHEIAREAAELPPCVISTGGGMLTLDRNAEVLRQAGKIILIDRSFDRIWQTLSTHPERPLLRGRSREDIREMYEARMQAYFRWADLYVHNYRIHVTAGRLATWAQTLQ